MSFLDRLRGNKNKTEEKTQTKAEPKVKSESEKHDDFVRRLREQTRSTQPQQSSTSMANRMNNKKAVPAAPVMSSGNGNARSGKSAIGSSRTQKRKARTVSAETVLRTEE